MKLRDMCRMFATELGLEANADEAERFCASIKPGHGDIEFNDDEVNAAREIFRKFVADASAHHEQTEKITRNN